MSATTYTVRIPAGVKLGEIASRSDSSRFAGATSVVCLLPPSDHEADSPHWAVATDSVILACKPVQCEGDVPFLPVPLPSGACNANRKDQVVTVNGEVRYTKGKSTVTEALPEGITRYPEIGEVIPMIEKDSVCITLDAHRSAKLAAGLGSDGKVTLVIQPSKAFAAIPVIAEHGIGVIMPFTDREIDHLADIARYRNMRHAVRTSGCNIRFAQTVS